MAKAKAQPATADNSPHPPGTIIACMTFPAKQEDGSYKNVGPGEPVPDAKNWPDLGLWIKRGYVDVVGGVAALRIAQKDPRRYVPPQPARAKSNEEDPGVPGAFKPDGTIGPTPDVKPEAKDLEKLATKELVELGAKLGLKFSRKSKKVMVAAIMARTDELAAQLENQAAG